MRFARILLAIVLMQLLPGLAVAHGEDKPGPNGGIVRMPGMFHTELVRADNDDLRIYLLDLHFNRKSVEGFSVKLEQQSAPGAGWIAHSCRMSGTYFTCANLPDSVLESGALRLYVGSDKFKGATMVYPLPLKSSIEEPHQVHQSHQH